MEGNLPEEGEPAPNIESTKKAKPTKKINDGSRKVLVQKIETTVYVFTDTEGRVYTSNTSQHMYIMGHMTLEKGLKMAQEDSSS